MSGMEYYLRHPGDDEFRHDLFGVVAEKRRAAALNKELHVPGGGAIVQREGEGEVLRVLDDQDAIGDPSEESLHI